MVAAAPLRIVFFGTPEFAVPTLEALLRSRHRVMAVISQPDRPKGRGQRLQPTPTKSAAIGAGVPVLQPERLRDEAFLRTLREMDVDLGVVAAYGKILPGMLLSLPGRGMINVHASLLPKYRGAAPVHRAVINGDMVTGVTIMRIVPELDAGPMMATAEHPIGPDDTSVDVERALAALGAPLAVDVVEQVAAGTATETPQDHARATVAPKIAREEGVVDWDRPAAEIHDLVRGLQPWPLVSVRLDSTRYLLHRTARTDLKTAEPGGTIVEAAGDRLLVACGDGGVLRILQVQPEGRRVMSARDLLSGRKIGVGARFARA